MLVDHVMFANSATRVRLWEGLEGYIARFVRLETEYRDLLAGEHLLEFLWLGGSFVSSDENPRNIDATVAVNSTARELLRGQPGSGWLRDAFMRKDCAQQYGVSPLEMPYRKIASVFRSRFLPPLEQDYLRERGAWDDWWQRCRDEAAMDAAPSIDTAHPVRGYLEVTL
jgi:hypothetical protein